MSTDVEWTPKLLSRVHPFRVPNCRLPGDPSVWTRLAKVMEPNFAALERGGLGHIADLLRERGLNTPQSLQSERDEAALGLAAGCLKRHFGFTTPADHQAAEECLPGLIQEWCRVGGTALAMRVVKIARTLSVELEWAGGVRKVDDSQARGRSGWPIPPPWARLTQLVGTR